MNLDSEDLRQFAPACERNRDAILAVLQRHIPLNPKAVLEIAAGTGEHSVHFAPHFPTASWHPTDLNPAALSSIQAWADYCKSKTVQNPVALDVREATWPVDEVDAILAVNMIHISEWACTEGLMAGAGKRLGEGGILYLYGPYKKGGEHTAPSNVDFDSWLKNQNPAWGVRDLEKVSDEAGKNGLALKEVVPMPANNFSIIFAKS